MYTYTKYCYPLPENHLTACFLVDEESLYKQDRYFHFLLLYKEQHVPRSVSAIKELAIELSVHNRLAFT